VSNIQPFLYFFRFTLIFYAPHPSFFSFFPPLSFSFFCRKKEKEIKKEKVKSEGQGRWRVENEGN
jgi:hypothetical protein